MGKCLDCYYHNGNCHNFDSPRMGKPSYRKEDGCDEWREEIVELRRRKDDVPVCELQEQKNG